MTQVRKSDIGWKKVSFPSQPRSIKSKPLLDRFTPPNELLAFVVRSLALLLQDQHVSATVLILLVKTKRCQKLKTAVHSGNSGSEGTAPILHLLCTHTRTHTRSGGERGHAGSWRFGNLDFKRSFFWFFFFYLTENLCQCC